MKKWECTICGYIHEGETPPDECPLCGAEKSLFAEVAEDSKEVEPEKNVPTEEQQPQAVSSSMFELMYDLTMKYHLHPISVHTPNGIMPFAFLLLLGAALFTSVSFESAAFYCLLFVLLNMPIVLFTGYVTWQKHYNGKMTPLFRLKIVSAAIATILLSILVFWRILRPEVMAPGSSAKLFYIFLALLLLGTIGIAGHMGGKLVFGGRKNNSN